MGKLKYLVLHCTATPEGREVTADEIRRWHTSAPPVGRGWKQVGYTDMIHLDGRVERLVDNNEDAQVDSWEITNGAKGYNTTARHVPRRGDCRPQPAGGESLPLVQRADLVEINRNKPIKRRMK